MKIFFNCCPHFIPIGPSFRRKFGVCFDCSCHWMQLYKLLRKNENYLNSQCCNKKEGLHEVKQHVVVHFKSSPNVKIGGICRFSSSFLGRHFEEVRISALKSLHATSTIKLDCSTEQKEISASSKWHRQLTINLDLQLNSRIVIYKLSTGQKFHLTL